MAVSGNKKGALDQTTPLTLSQRHNTLRHKTSVKSRTPVARVPQGQRGQPFRHLVQLPHLPKGEPDDLKLIAGITPELAAKLNKLGLIKFEQIANLSDDDIEKTLRINLTAQFWTCKAFLPSMIQRGSGHIVNFASAGGILSLPNLSAYCASKFGVVGFSDSLRQEMKKHRYNIGVTYVCPNTVNTGMFEGSKMVAGTRMLSASDVTQKVIRAIKSNQAMVAVPGFPVKILTPLTKVLLPIGAMDWLNKMLGMATCNDSWKGRSC